WFPSREVTLFSNMFSFFQNSRISVAAFGKSIPLYSVNFVFMSGFVFAPAKVSNFFNMNIAFMVVLRGYLIGYDRFYLYLSGGEFIRSQQSKKTIIMKFKICVISLVF